jgi:TM2 domain-containing membrane protein YozV
MSSETTDTSALFMETAKGRYPLSNNAGSARAWAPKHITLPDPQDPTQTVESAGAHVPRPDRSLTTLRFISVLGILGLDHFYLRSPKTGLLKMMTLGGFGLWWVWDIAQTLFEGDRVVKYGMTSPFDLQQGIGQGMITDQGSRYSQRSSYMVWILAVIFGFLGLDMLMLGQVGQFVRKLIMGTLTMSCLLPRVKPYSDWGFGDFFWVLVGSAFGGGLILSYITTFNRVFNEPEQMLDGGKDGGIPLSSMADQWMNWNRSFIPPDDTMNVEDFWVFHSIPAQALSQKFWIEHETDPPAPPPDDSDDGNSWVTAGLANYGYMIRWVIQKILNALVQMIAVALAAATGGASVGVEAGATAGVEVGAEAAAEGAAEGVAERAAERAAAKEAEHGMFSKLTGKFAKKLPGKAKGMFSKAQEAYDKAQEISGKVNDVTSKIQQVQSFLPQASSPPSPPPSPNLGPQASPNGLQQQQQGGAKSAALSTESYVLGGTAFALIAGGAVKALIDYVMPE